MRFCQLDRITEIVPGEKLTAIKSLSLAEDYLQDHFPRFPVMPGVMMVEAMFQASMWLVRHAEDFQHGMVVMRSTRNMKFGDFVEPGDQLMVEAKIKSLTDQPDVAVSAKIDGRVAVKGRLGLERYNLSQRGLGAEAADAYLRKSFRNQFQLLCGRSILIGAPA